MKRRGDRRRGSGAAGVVVVSGLALGLRDALGPKEPPAIVIQEGRGHPPAGDLILFFHPQVPEATLVLMR
jgi:hypothetical protein